MAADLSPQARAYARAASRAMMTGRRGHGGTTRVVHRQMTEAQLFALIALSFDQGRASVIDQGREGGAR